MNPLNKTCTVKLLNPYYGLVSGPKVNYPLIGFAAKCDVFESTYLSLIVAPYFYFSVCLRSRIFSFLSFFASFRKESPAQILMSIEKAVRAFETGDTFK